MLEFTKFTDTITTTPRAMHDAVWAFANAMNSYDRALGEIRGAMNDLAVADKEKNGVFAASLRTHSLQSINEALKSIGY